MVKVTKRPNGRRRVQLICKDPTRTEQTHKKECDINVILAKSVRNGLPTATMPGARYGDFSDVGDYQTCLDRVQEAHEQFLNLPSDIRKFFRNDPGALVEFMSNEANRDKAIEMGLIAGPDPVETPTPPEQPAAPADPPTA